MKYQLKDLCSITKGAIGIMKADGGKYPLVALSDERKSHSEFQFDANAVIVPLISSTGHGHASMKRVHYQEGKFALGNILCAVIPKDEKKLNAKYLHLYLQQFKESLLVPLMKGAANVSLPMNKLADVEIEVPSLERQVEIIALEDEAGELKNELDEKLILQDDAVTKLRQAILREAIQGKLVKQDKKDGNATDLLKKIKAEKEKLIAEKKLKIEKELPPIKAEEIPFGIPKNWVWCRLRFLINPQMGLSYGVVKPSRNDPNGVVFIKSGNVGDFVVEESIQTKITKELDQEFKRTKIRGGEILITLVGASIGRCAIVPNSLIGANVSRAVGVCSIIDLIDKKYFVFGLYGSIQNLINTNALDGSNRPVLNLETIRNIAFPLPPLPEQKRIVKKLDEVMTLCDELKTTITNNQNYTEMLLQVALKDALKPKKFKNLNNLVLQ